MIVEIEETGIIPTKICGKFLTSAFSKYFIHKTVAPNPLVVDKCLFIQILNDEGLKDDTRKKEQGKIIMRKINDLGDKGSVSEYCLFWYSCIEENESQLIDKIKEHLAKK